MRETALKWRSNSIIDLSPVHEQEVVGYKIPVVLRDPPVDRQVRRASVHHPDSLNHLRRSFACYQLEDIRTIASPYGVDGVKTG